MDQIFPASEHLSVDRLAKASMGIFPIANAIVMSDWLANISDVQVPARAINKKMSLRKAFGRNVLVRYAD